MSKEGHSVEGPEKLRDEIALGFLYAHARLSENAKTAFEASAFLYGLVELLAEKGIISIEELDKRKAEVAKRLVKKNKENGTGVLLQEPEYDKYKFGQEAEIDCASRVQLCGAACCRLPFALSKQDVREGILHWELGQPYIIAQDKDGFCTHLDRSGCQCTVRESRPVPCRAYDCRKDKAIWLDFHKKIINPDIFQQGWPRNVPEEEAGRAME